MDRDDRFKLMSNYAMPDHRLLPKRVQEQIDKLPRNERRIRKKVIGKAWPIADAYMRADALSGAGYPIDAQLREFLAEYNDRQLGHGLATLPSSFNVFEGFLKFNINEPVNFFSLRSEKDHLFSLEDFLDFVTSDDQHAKEAVSALSSLEEGKINNFTPVGDARDFSFLHSESSRFVIGGFTLVRREDYIHWALIGGPICDLKQKTAELIADPEHEDLGVRPREKIYINPDPGLEFRAEPLVGTDDVWKTLIFGLFNLKTGKQEIKAVGRDLGNRYLMNIDDPDLFCLGDPRRMSNEQRSFIEAQSEKIAEHALLFDIAETCFQLVNYFQFRITLIREAKKDTELAKLSEVGKAKLSHLRDDRRPVYKVVQSIEFVNVGAAQAIRKYSAPRFAVEVEGFWRRLDPGAMGKDRLGAPVKGRTWIKGHLRWREKPSRAPEIFIKSSVASAKIRAAAIVESDATARTVGIDLSPLYNDDFEKDSSENGWIYLMRCPLMEDDVYKVGWSSRSPKIRAEELSSATGVPLAYIVVESWPIHLCHDDPKILWVSDAEVVGDSG